ncbi:hypothetical protein J437_LFUL019038 [Ladona fulva]|uniref:Reverse transcriptase domain-containing protein n=1 Tax=Ladona fulva TaxID=123851 RepID=A0A8K0JWP9_LADFU|nr:hypothetical protein J437_LFUL019038 [Ladona fulva]
MMGMPAKMVELIRDLYSGTTTCFSLLSEETEEIAVSCGVRQGDPLSPILFNLAIEPVISAALLKRPTAGYSFGPTSIAVLAYADDILLIGRNAGMLRSLLFSIGTAAEWCGLSFNGKKCATLHLDLRKGGSKLQDSHFQIQKEEMKALEEGESYRYLGCPIGFETDSTPDAALRNFRNCETLRDLRILSESSLLPWQKIDALQVLPLSRLTFPLRIAAVSLKKLAEADNATRRSVKRWMGLPQYASREIVTMRNAHGGGGYMPLQVEHCILTTTQAFHMLSSRDAVVKEAAWYSLQDAVHRRIGKKSSPPTRELLCKYLCGSMEEELARDAGDVASLWTRTKRAARSLAPLCKIEWQWSEARKELRIRVANPSPSSELVVVPQSAYRRIHQTLREAVFEGKRRELSGPDSMSSLS